MSFSDFDAIKRAILASQAPKWQPRMVALDAGVDEVQRRRRRQVEALDRIDRGTARWADYVLVMGESVDRLLHSAVPSLGVRRDRRTAGIARGKPFDDGPAHHALEILSYPPQEPLPEDLKAAPEAWANTVDDPAATPDERLTAAQALLMLGAEAGLPRRTRIWQSGAVEQRSGETCDRLVWRNIGIVDWDVIDEILRTNPNVEGHVEPNPATTA